MAKDFDKDTLREMNEYIQAVSEMSDESVNDETIQMIRNTLQERINITASAENIRNVYNEFRANGMSKRDCQQARTSMLAELDKMLQELDFKNEKKIELVRLIFDSILVVYDKVIDMFNNYYETLYFEKTHENAQLPTYAHEDDACCDIYSPEDVVIPANARGFAVSTGLKPVIPDGYELLIRPRSGMSMKTCMRVSNCVATIDSGYTGEIRILFDNLSDEPYNIKMGDRIAQFALKPVYRFYSKFTDDAAAMKKSSRGGKGFGSTDK